MESVFTYCSGAIIDYSELKHKQSYYEYSINTFFCSGADVLMFER
ncbi:hypothetical protein BCF53_10588 [Reinekea marinisedimentorum]|uniref:Uncharacterized protein n=1 Tax=Reinekea marinisedimentorum TaxID=230495 RepID=A0A4R3I8K2_9GAMM|nr:hypothetical protein BCF53_10588 [Reinekea marinisedimentorum]